MSKVSSERAPHVPVSASDRTWSSAGRAAIVCIGDELNRGEVVDRNAAWLGEQLSDLGYQVMWRFGVNDIESDMIEALRRACSCASVVLVSGGLGPTSDDLTVDVAAGLIGSSAVVDQAHEDRLRARFAERKRDVPALALRQVRVPAGATVLANPVGLAPGFAIHHEDCELFFMPGVPAELKAIFATAIAPRLRQRLPAAYSQQKTTLRVFGLTEGQTDQKLRDLLPELVAAGRDGLAPTRTTLHYRLAFPEILVTLVTTGDTTDAQTHHMGLLRKVRDRLGDAAYGELADELPLVIGRALRQAGAKLATAESCTGGLLGALITGVAGCSDYYQGGVISYANEAKVQQLGVREETLLQHGAVSRECVEEMARGARERFNTTYGVAISGVAGPGGGTPEKPVGTVHIAVCGPMGIEARAIYWPGDREDIRRLSAITALHLLLRAIRATDPSKKTEAL
ncbi:MAG: CinA family nicotinamide mononucleotide deamidase-related protein [Myxococcales bacterium]|nr:CinA family nicotinamide mononucleotide deamidase-related protein [Myxococcales bacterium]